jgi:hypothetical protein
VVTAARVITVEEFEFEFGPGRALLLTTMFQTRFRELWAQLREGSSEGG